MSLRNRKLSYSDSINHTLDYLLTIDNSVILIGQGVKSPWYVGSTCNGLVKKFGESRIMDTPISENGITGVAVGAAIVGMKPIIVSSENGSSNSNTCNSHFSDIGVSIIRLSPNFLTSPLHVLPTYQGLFTPCPIRIKNYLL